jgi:hypothetical protein
MPEQSIWGSVYSLSKPHLTLDQYIAEALKIPFSKTEFELPEAKVEELIAGARRIDTSICENLALKDSKGHQYLVHDAASFEMVVDGGRSRAMVTDTSDSRKIVSQNPLLLQWAVDLQKASKAR